MVISEDQGMLMLRRANPVPETETEAVVVDARLHLHQADEQRSSEVTQLTTQEKETPKRNRTSMAWLAAAVLVVVVGAAIMFLNQGGEEAPPAADVVPTTAALPSTTVIESALADIPVWLRSGNGQWQPAMAAVPFAFTNEDDWNSRDLALTEERFTICPPSPDGGFAMCNLASVAVLFLEPETVDETRDLLASFEGAELGEEQPVTIDGAPGIRFEFTHDVPPLIGQGQGELSVPAAVVGTATERTPLGEGPLGRSIISIVDVDGVIVTLAFQGRDVSRGAPEDSFNTYRDSGLAIIDSIIWGTP